MFQKFSKNLGNQNFQESAVLNWDKKEYEIRHGLDQPWMCHMPDIIGFIAVFIGIGK